MQKNIYRIILALSWMLIFISSTLATSITFTFANGQITGPGPKFYEFDVMVKAGTAGTKLGDTQTYINYNTTGFGSSIVNNNKATITRGTLLQGQLLGSDLYTIVNITDNTSSRIAITANYNFSSSFPTQANDVPTSPTQLLHIKIKILNENVTAGLSFQNGVNFMDNQQFESDNFTRYSPVNTGSGDDTSLPVELTTFDYKITGEGVALNWVTESEINNLGFEISRSTAEEGNYLTIASYTTHPELQGQGNSSARHEYSFTDKFARVNNTYWYKLADVDFNGKKTFHGPLKVEFTEDLTVPTAFKLHQNFPNPFNPSTTLKFDIPRTSRQQIHASLVIYNILGQVVTRLFDGKLTAGSYQKVWNGKSATGRSLPTGVYFAVFKADTYAKTIKLLLIK